MSHRIAIEDAPEAYEKLDKRQEGYTKTVIRFGQSKATSAAA